MSGILGSADLTAATNTSLYTVATGKVGSFSVNFCNRGTTAATVRLAICDTATPGNDEYVIYDFIIEPNGMLERSGLVAQAGKIVVVYSDNASVSAQAMGYEEVA